MTGHGTQFGRKKESVIAALLIHRTIPEAAAAAGISGSTIGRWLKDPEFQAAYREAKRAGYEQSTARLHQMRSAAVATLGKIMVDPKTPPATKARVAETIINQSSKAFEAEEVEERLSELERRIEESGRA
jgi:hypothetical protein